MQTANHRTPRLRRLSEEHACELAALERSLCSHPWSEEQLRFGLRESAVHALGLALDSRLLGYCLFYVVLDEAEIVNLAVEKDERCKGYGRRLLGGMLQTAAEMGIQRVYLEVRASNGPARHLYGSEGFAPVGVRPGYYPDTGEDAILMERRMDESGQRAKETK